MIGWTTNLALALLAADPGAGVPAWAAAPPPKLPERMRLTLERYRYFTDCVAASEWDLGRQLFDARIGSAEESRLLNRMTGGSDGSDCSYAWKMRMTTMLMRGGFAESRYRLVTRNRPAPPVPADAAPVPAGASFAWVGFNRDSPAPLLYAFATCLAERETGAVHAVLAERIGTKEERIALQGLSRRFGTCLRPGQRVQANSLTLRPWLAEAIYQRFRTETGDRA
jgi:hypothetical protein